MTAVVLCLRAHQPPRLARLRFVDVGHGRPCFDEAAERRAVEHAAEHAYAPAFALVLAAIEASRGRFRCAVALAGDLLGRLERWAPAAYTSIVRLARTGAVDFACSPAVDPGDDAREAEATLAELRRDLWDVTGVWPRTLACPEGAPRSALARTADALGFECLLADAGPGPRDAVHRIAGCRRLRLLPCAPATAPLAPARAADAACLALDLDGGPAARARSLALLGDLSRVALDPALRTETPWEAVRARPAADVVDLAADGRPDAAANELQREARRRLAALLPAVRAAAGRAPALLREWRRLAAPDHALSMSVPGVGPAAGDPGPVLDSPASSPHDSFIKYMHALDDLEARVAPAPRRRAARTTAKKPRRSASRRTARSAR